MINAIPMIDNRDFQGDYVKSGNKKMIDNSENYNNSDSIWKRFKFWGKNNRNLLTAK